jgi:solute carrier family 25 (mitochondrial phosphate transporter), member 3
MKTRKQIDPSLDGKSFLEVTREIIQNEGKRALWAGIGPTFWGYLFEGAVKFGVYEVLKPGVKAILARVATWTSIALFDSKIVAFVLCGTASGVAASFMVCPMEALRIRMVSEPEFAPHGMLQGSYKMLQREGVSGLSKGMKPMLMKQVPYTVTKNVSFDFLTTFFYAILRMQGAAMSAATSFTVPLVAAGIASILSCISSQPGDMLLSLINAHEGEISTRDLLRNVMRSKQGVRGLFVGFKTRMLHVGIIVTLQLLIYDYAKRICGIAATGSF